jgi:hypothetical protein
MAGLRVPSSILLFGFRGLFASSLQDEVDHDRDLDRYGLAAVPPGVAARIDNGA